MKLLDQTAGKVIQVNLILVVLIQWMQMINICGSKLSFNFCLYICIVHHIYLLLIVCIVFGSLVKIEWEMVAQQVSDKEIVIKLEG